MRQKRKLTEAYPDWFTGGGLFASFNDEEMPWHEAITGLGGFYLDIEYYGNRSGSKEVSALLDYAIEKGPETLAQTKEYIKHLILGKYKLAWQRAWDAMIAEYNPINNYSMDKQETEDRTLDITNQRVIDRNLQEDGSEGGTHMSTTDNDGTITNNGTGSNTYNSNTNNGIYGFDAGASSNANKSDTTQSNNSTNNNTETIDTGTVISGEDERTHDNNITEKVTTGDEGQHKTVGTFTTKTTGNIGVTTSQEMVESELTLRFDWHYFDMVYRDVDHILTTGVFVDDEPIYHIF